MPYRINSPPPFESDIPPLTLWQRYGFEIMGYLKVTVAIVTLLGIFGIFVAGTATALQFVVEGFAGTSVGKYPHYVTLVFLWSLYTLKES